MKRLSKARGKDAKVRRIAASKMAKITHDLRHHERPGEAKWL
jgi:hypothetical protein